MKRLALAALVLAGLALSAHGQRGGARGGFAVSSAPATRGGFGGSAAHGAPRTPMARTLGTSSATRVNSPLFRPGSSAPNRYRRPYPDSRGRSVFVLPFWNGWIDPGLPGLPDNAGYGEPSVAPDYAQGDPGAGQPQDAALAGPNGPYEMPYATSSGVAASSEMPRTGPAPPSVPSPPPMLEPEDAMTLVFRDGRPTEQIHNYALTRSTLYVLDKPHREIPLNQLDLDATERRNHEAGLDFKVPEARK